MPREGYNLVDRVIRTVDSQTGDPQPDRIPDSKVVLILADYGNETPKRVREAIQEAIDAGDLSDNNGDLSIPA